MAQAKEHDIFDLAPFLRSRLFSANGYKHANGNITKTFTLTN
jgi:DNA replication licensing factor MCM2